MQSSVRCPPVTANNFEIKHSVLQAIQNNCVFSGQHNENPTNHLMGFDEIMNTFHYNGASDDAIYLRALPFSLKYDAKIWLRSLPSGLIHTWEEMMTKFLDKYFSPTKTRMKKEINNFGQLESETVFEAWDRLKELLKRCPHNVGGPLMKKTYDEALEILNELSEDVNQWILEGAERNKVVRVHQVDAYTTQQNQIADVSKDVKQLIVAQVQIEQPMIGNYQGENNFNPTKHKKPEFSWNLANGSLNQWQQNNPRGQGQAQSGYQNQQRQQFQGQQPQRHQSRLRETMGKMATMLSKGTEGTLPSDTEKNLKKVKAVTLRCGKALEEAAKNPKI
ncbi:uncharacterized protein LOC132613120 [Lycium barbarum]|uniref:uncharacterized protein LOC132613120 n=1 Tax=Lycium barbarum TaxID=112863 RepID=UPI00293E43FA|nr:uncharacterized protein LOC132613120 [Lycium barbarum]